MARYAIRYVCESPLISDKVVTLEFEAHTARFSFPLEETERGRIHVTLEVEAEGWKEADLKAQGVLQPMGDAIAFATGQPFLISYWDFVRKDQHGEEFLQAVWCQRREQPNQFFLSTELAAEAQALLQQEAKGNVGLCWHRYALQRGYWFDRFVFQWLAFERLAGETQVNSICKNCGDVSNHLGANRAEAYRIFQGAEPEMSEKDFRDEVWGRDRNIVFHGSKYPGPAHLRRLNDRFPILRKACEREISRRLGLPYRARPIGQAETHFFAYHFIEWKTAEPEKAIGGDFPWQEVQKEFSNRPIEGAWMSVPSESYTSLSFQRDAANW